MKEAVNVGYDYEEGVDSFCFVASQSLSRRFFPSRECFIVDIGSGGGRYLLCLKKLGYHNLIAVDKDKTNFEKLGSKGIRCIAADLEKDTIPLSSSCADAIFCFHIIEHLFDPQLIIKETLRILKKDGVLLLVTPNWRKQYKFFWRDPTHRHPYDRDSVLDILHCADLKIVWIRNFGVIRPLGRTGIWKIFKSLIFTGIDIIAVARKDANP